MASRQKVSNDLVVVGVQPSRWQRAFVGARRALIKNPNMLFGLILLIIMSAMAIFSALITDVDPRYIDTIERLRSPSSQYLFGTDHLGRDIFARVVYGSRLSLIVGIAVAIITMVGGVVMGLISGYYRTLDAIIMRLMDGLMAIPSFLLAIALVAMLGASLQNVIIALSVVETPRVVRVVRSSVLTLRERVYVEAAEAIGARGIRIMARHIFPNTVPPLIVQGTYIFALAILVEAGLSFLGAGTPPDIPSWGNIMGEARLYVRVAEWIMFFPGLFLSLTVLAINLIGDGLRDTLDPTLARRM
jgi:peptide/nickel transport system permease protein